MEALVNDNRALTGRVRLSSAPGFATRKLVPFIREFTEAHPGISVDIQTGGTRSATSRRALSTWPSSRASRPCRASST